MGIFDSFSAGPGRQAARNAYAHTTGGIVRGGNLIRGGSQQAINALKAGARPALGAIRRGTRQAAGAYTDALSPFDEIYDQEQLGRNAYLDALGLQGAEGSTRARDMFQAGPGYQWEMDQGNEALNRTAASRGLLTSGNNTQDILEFSQGLANQEWDEHLGRLGGFNPLAVANSRAGILQNLAGLYANAGTNEAGIHTGLGRDVAGVYGNRANTLADLALRLGQAGATLEGDQFAAEQGANQNIWNAVGSVAGLGANVYGMGSPSKLGWFNA